MFFVQLMYPGSHCPSADKERNRIRHSDEVKNFEAKYQVFIKMWMTIMINNKYFSMILGSLQISDN